MKKRIAFIILLILLLNGCSVNEKMNSDIFFERLSAIDEDFDYENSYIIRDGSDCLCFIKDKYSDEYILSFSVNESDDIYKISFACSVTDKAENFIKYIRDIINVFSSNENTEMIIKELTENGKILPSYSYYETQWYSCSVHSDENGFYFSVINKKISVSE